jgi:hypothetical protein
VKGAAIALAFVMIAFEFALLISGSRVLISEHRVNPGDTYVLPDWGNLGSAQQAQLVCRYFTGRSVKATVLWYSSNNIMGADECPFLARRGS